MQNDSNMINAILHTIIPQVQLIYRPKSKSKPTKSTKLNNSLNQIIPSAFTMQEPTCICPIPTSTYFHFSEDKVPRSPQSQDGTNIL